MSPSLDKNDKHTTSFTFSKIDSMNVNNNTKTNWGHVLLNSVHR